MMIKLQLFHTLKKRSRMTSLKQVKLIIMRMMITFLIMKNDRNLIIKRIQLINKYKNLIKAVM